MVQTMPALGHSAARQHALEAASLLHPHPELVTAPLFDGRQPFFLAVDKVQVKYEMLRAHLVDGLAVTVAAANHGYSRPAFYLVEASFQERGMLGLLDERRGRQGPLKLTPEIIAYLRLAEPARSGAELADEIERLFHIKLHRRTVERARRR
jgi:transposase